MNAHDFLKALTIVMCTAGITTVLFQYLRQPVVLGYILAGLLVGPHVPVPLVADRAVVQTLSELGVILLMFSLGLEFSLRKLLEVGAAAMLTAVIECSLMMWLGYVAGRAFGWTPREAVFTGAIVAIASTTIIAKAFEEQRIAGRLRDLVVGVLVVEDLIAVLLMATLTALASGESLSAATIAKSSGRLGAFLIVLLTVGLLAVPRTIRAIVRLNRAETTLVASIGICFACALAALELGYSVALGAFIAGSLVAESGEESVVEHLVLPLRDVFAAIFFVSVGMMIEPAVLLRHWVAVLTLTAVVIVGKVANVTVGAFLTGNGTRTSVQAGMSLAQIGEFSFIIASLGTQLGAVGDFLYPIAVSVSALTTLTTPGLIRASGPAALWIDRKLPRPLQTFAALYASWVEQLRSGGRSNVANAALRRLIKLLLVDSTGLGLLVVATSATIETDAAFLAHHLGIGDSVGYVLVLVGAGLLATPFAVGLFRIVARLGHELAEQSLPPSEPGRLDLAAAPRRALVVTIQLAMLLIVGAPMLAITQPFLPGFEGAALMVAILLALALGFWRSATNLQGHVRAGAQVIVEALVAQARAGARPAAEHALDRVKDLVPGLGALSTVELTATSAAVGETLATLDLRGRTGATVLAITRGEAGITLPTAHERLAIGDVLAIAGTHEAVDAAIALIGGARDSTRDPRPYTAV